MPEDKPLALVGAVQAGLRRQAERAIARDYPTIEREMRATFRDPSPLPLLDLATLELARTLADRAVERPMRVRRLVEAARVDRGVPFAVVGDSHSAHLVRRARQGERWLAPLHLLCTGASARGLINPESAAGAGERVRRFLEVLAPMPTPMPVVFMFGQVDAEFVFNFKRLEADAERFDEAGFEGFATETVARYVAFLAETTPASLRPLARVAGIFPPALSDRAWRQGYVNAHIADLHGPADAAGLAQRLKGLDIPPLATRTRLHARFNALLFEAAQAEGFGVLDGWNRLIGPGGTLDPRYLGNGRGANHHMGYAASRRPVVETLWLTLD